MSEIEFHFENCLEPSFSRQNLLVCHVKFGQNIFVGGQNRHFTVKSNFSSKFAKTIFYWQNEDLHIKIDENHFTEGKSVSDITVKVIL